MGSRPLKVTHSLPAREVHNLEEAWWYARQELRLPFNCMVTIRPSMIDSLTPRERRRLWNNARNKIDQFARDHRYGRVQIWSLESVRGTGVGEHLHLLTHVPCKLTKRFCEVVSGWFTEIGEIHMRGADYKTNIENGKRRSAITYITKNSPQAAYRTNRSYQLGGPIEGKRAGCSRNIDARARSIRGLLTASNDNNPHSANDSFHSAVSE